MHADERAVKRSHASGTEAFALIAKYGHPAHPHVYETWYTYVDGTHRALSEAIDAVLRTRQTIDAVEISAIYQAHLSPTRISEKIESVGDTVSGELDQVLGMIAAARNSADAYGRSLEDLGRSLGIETDPRSMRVMVEGLVREMASTNAELGKKLTESRRQMVRLKGNLEAARAESLTDPLTLLGNRKSFEATMAKALAENAPFSLLLADIDRFKQFNDTFGHLTGDQVLRLVAATVKQNVKGRDTVARFGGEELAIILPQTLLSAARATAENIREAVMTRDLIKRSTGEKLGRITMSIGVSTWRPGDTAQSLVERADQALYAAKGAGRNCVFLENEAPAPPDFPQRAAEAS